MIDYAKANGASVANVTFQVAASLECIDGEFGLVLDRHAPFDLRAVEERLLPGGYFVTQQYVVHDIESLVFWLNALDMLHADVDGAAASANSETLNAILKDSVEDRGFITNEHRYLAVLKNR